MPLSENDKAELVAYLDGELDEQATQAVEARLATDADARAELDTLKQTWGMLDYLPKASPSPNFTNRTMERLTLVALMFIDLKDLRQINDTYGAATGDALLAAAAERMLSGLTSDHTTVHAR